MHLLVRAIVPTSERNCTCQCTQLYISVHAIVPARASNCTYQCTHLHLAVHEIAPGSVLNCICQCTKLHLPMHAIAPASARNWTCQCTQLHLPVLAIAPASARNCTCKVTGAHTVNTMTLLHKSQTVRNNIFPEKSYLGIRVCVTWESVFAIWKVLLSSRVVPWLYTGNFTTCTAFREAYRVHPVNWTYEMCRNMEQTLHMSRP